MSLDKFDKYSTSITNKNTSAKEIWNSMCVRFEGTKEEIGESSSHMELVVSKEEESSTSGRTIDESIHVEHEQDHLYLMGHRVVFFFLCGSLQSVNHLTDLFLGE